MVKKELKLSVRTPRLAVLMVAFNAVLTLIGGSVMFFIRETARLSGQITFRYNIYLYILLACIEFGLLLFIVPTITAGLIAGEREKQTLDILLTSGMRSGQIVTGKLISAAANILLIVISGLPVPGIVFIYGGIDVRDILLTLSLLVFAVFYIGSIGVFCSSLFKKTTFASLLTYGIEIFMVFGTFLAVYFATYITKINTNYMSADIGLFSVFLLLSPGITFAYMLFDQVASLSNVNTWFVCIGMPEFAADHFVVISLVVQSIFAVAFILLAVRFLKERNRKPKNRR